MKLTNQELIDYFNTVISRLQDDLQYSCSFDATKRRNIQQDISYMKATIEVLSSQDIAHWEYNPDGMDWNLPAWCCSACKCKNDMIPTHVQGKNGMVQVKNPYAWAGSSYCPSCGKKMEPEYDDSAEDNK